MLVYTLLILFAGGLQALAARVQVTWDVGYLNISRDGISTWRAIGANGQLPIPPIYITQGDVLELTAINHLDKPLSLHTHGLFQRNSTYYDGTGMVTECGIPPNAQFTYIIETCDQSGTYWVHAHYEMEGIDGLRAALVILDQDTSLLDEYDEDVLLTLEDWGKEPYDDHIKQLQTIAEVDMPPNHPSVLINGINANILQPIRFTPGRRYRLRVVSMSFTYWFKVRLPGHTMQVIEADGISSHPSAVDGLDLCPGQRYSVIITAHKSLDYNYALNVTFYNDFIVEIPGATTLYHHVPIVYNDNAPVKTFPVIEDKDVKWADELAMEPRDEQVLLEPVDQHIVRSVKALTKDLGIPIYAFGNYSYAPVPVPPLLTALTTGNMALSPSVYAPQLNAIILQHNQIMELELRNPDSIIVHTYHSHGHAFQVVESGPVNKNSSVPVKRFKGRYPMRRDTITLALGQYVRVRIKADNPGVWYQHCHQEQHNYSGLAFTLVEAPDVMQRTLHVPSEMLEFCRILGHPTQGNSAGRVGSDMTGIEPPLAIHGHADSSDT
ncbi:ferroxidase fet3 [Coemansia sp. RSA 1822]|nr:ferroxidase fet3 [Coemansia sp. RSA 638]KAJ2545266.1 ferroxidase fet3 [Coemansia sp. RSA 1853]KAJ2562281.1 ferroxidase fet3 [Coemansia sp. RSA 1822]